MKHFSGLRIPAVLAALLVLIAPVSADVKLPSVISNNMILQRDFEVPIWGTAQPGEKVTVELGEQKQTTEADKEGKWSVKLSKMKANSKGQTLTVSGKNKVEIKDVLIGEVWFCSGQSNMEWRVRQSMNAQQEIAKSANPRIRHIKIPHRPSAKPEQDVPSTGWQSAGPKTTGEFTGVGYFFARTLEKELDVPIGLIGCNWGGTRIEPWTPPVGFKSVPALKNIADNLADFPAKRGGGINHQSPLALYNGMVSPIVPYAVRGALWYQGESNNGEGMLYFEKMKALIKGWRTIWDYEDMPFYFVQLAPFRYGNRAPEALAGIWEAQLKTLSLPNTGMAVTVDIGNTRNIHPTNKQEVGRRLALWALAKDYGKKDLVYSGPLYKSMKREGNSIAISFDHVGGGLVSRDGKPLTRFQIAGADKKFVDAKAVIEGDKVIVSAEGVKEPVAVRFGWHQEAEPNLSNKDGLPASPFRTDDWK